MTAAAPRIANRTTDNRRLGIAMVMLIAVLALVVAVAIGQQVAKSSTTASSTTHELVVGHIRYTGIPYPAPDVVNPGLRGRDLFNAAELAKVPNPGLSGRDLFNAAELSKTAGSVDSNINFSGVPNVALQHSQAASAGTLPAASGINIAGVPWFVTNDLRASTPKQIPTR